MVPTALVVDQNTDTGGKLAYWLTTLGVPATVVRNTDEAAQSLSASTPPRLVVVSNELPDMERFARLRHADPVLSHAALMVILGRHRREPDSRLDPTYVIANAPENPDFIFAVTALRDGKSPLDLNRVH
jgi:DNA-binding response OmpR family regulator